MEEGDERSLKLGAATRVDRGGRECLPDDRFADVGRDEEVDPAPESVALLEELVEEDDDEGRDDELEDEQEANSSSEVRGESVQSRQDVDGSLSERDDEGEDCIQMVSAPTPSRRVPLLEGVCTHASELH